MFEGNAKLYQQAISTGSEKFLLEAAHEIQSQAQRNTSVGRVNGGKTKGSWDVSDIMKGDYISIDVGSPEENAIWEEFGTGDYALKGDGRKGGWYIPIGEGKNQMSMAVAKAYGMTIRKGKNGKMFVFTHGKRPKRAFQKALDYVEPMVENMLQSAIEGELK